MLHSIIDFFVCFYGSPFIIIALTSLFLTVLDYNVSKRKNLNTYSIKINKVIGKNLTYNFFSKIASCYLLTILIIWILSKTYVYNNTISEFFLSNNNLLIFLNCSIIFYFLQILITGLRATSYKQNINLVLSFLLIILPYIYICNSFILLFFAIEVISISAFLIILNSLIPVENTNKKNKLNVVYNVNHQKLNTNYRYNIFIYYWLSFFFSIFFFLLILVTANQYNFIEITTLNIISFTYPKSSITVDSISVIFLILLLVKFGLPPIHFQKLSIYKGLPINLSLIYSIIVITGYFFVFSNLTFSLYEILVNFKSIFKDITIIKYSFLINCFI